MRKEYDFSRALNSRFGRFGKQVGIELDYDTIAYFREEAKNSGIPYQNLIGLYLKDCAKNNRRIEFSWKEKEHQ
jgi:hypothetical protein